jgi:hypothetical protein
MLEQLSGTIKLTEWTPRGKVPPGFIVQAVILGRDEGQLALEVVVLGASPGLSMSRETLGAFHASRLAKRVTPVVVAAERDGETWLFGPNAGAAVFGPLPTDLAQRMLQSALDEPSGIAARQRLAAMYSAIEGTTSGAGGDHLPGIANGGLFATHELRYGVRRRPDWSSACDAADALLLLRRDALIEALGYTAQQAAAHALILTVEGVVPRAVAVLLDEDESFDGDSTRFSVSPVAYAVSIAQKHELPWVMILRGSQLRLYPARAELGVGRKGLAETFFEVDLALVTQETAGYLSLVFSAKALAVGGSTAEILSGSVQYAVELGERLRFQVYDQIVPKLSLAIAAQLPALGHELDRAGLDLAYRLTLRVFFRLLFQAYAEDRKLLPYGENPRYDRNALNTLTHDLVENPDEIFDPESTTLWDDLAQVWRVIDKGDKAWSVPPYNGGLFGSDRELEPEGALLDRVAVTNDVMGPVLRAMLIDTDLDEITGAIDFRSLSVREFGTIYEGLLESNLAVADIDLVLDDKDTWVPATAGEPLDPERTAPAGSVYFHNTSGQRKGTGSYFTPSFVVEHLLERALDPTLDEHLARVKELLDAGDQAGAADLFFDFRIADLAMGSGHFLTAAIDHLETAMAAFLADSPIPGVTNELRHLEAAARDAAGPDAPEPEPSTLLRRQIARRCVYGLDINPIAVELARVSIWIHTFVRGLPMSSLDHNLVCANSLTGIGTVDEALDALVPGRNGAATLFDSAIEDALERARTLLVDVANAAEATRKEAQEASRAVMEAKREAENARLLFDAAVLRRLGHEALVAAVEPDEIAQLARNPAAEEQLDPLAVGHMPFLFPEVFLRDGSGFDVLIGNPPWEKLKVEEHQWWGLRFPGLRSLPMSQRTAQIAALREQRSDLETEYQLAVAVGQELREILSAGPYPGIGSGHVDLYKAFAWRNWHLMRSQGAAGLVLPGAVLNGAGTERWRREILERGEFMNVVVTVNTGGWVFDTVHGQYSTALAVLKKDPSRQIVRFGGPFHSYAEFDLGRKALASVAADEFLGWSASASFPRLPDQESVVIFRRMREQSEFRDGLFRPVIELRPVEDRSRIHTDLANPFGPIPVLTGGSVGMWNPDYGDPYGYASTDLFEHLLTKTRRSSELARSPFHGIVISSVEELPCSRPRVAFRDVTRATDSRTCIAALLPPRVAVMHSCPYLLRTAGDESDEAYILGVMTSIPFDWYARKIVELHLTFDLLGSIPVPVTAKNDHRRSRVVELAGTLAARDERFAVWADQVGVLVGAVKTDDVRDEHESELDALVAHLYGLSRDQLTHIFETFHRGWDYAPRLERALAYFDVLGGTE